MDWVLKFQLQAWRSTQFCTIKTFGIRRIQRKFIVLPFLSYTFIFNYVLDCKVLSICARPFWKWLTVKQPKPWYSTTKKNLL